MTNFYARLHKQFDDACVRFRHGYSPENSVWSVDVLDCMVKNSNDYDADVIEHIKKFLNYERT